MCYQQTVHRSSPLAEGHGDTYRDLPFLRSDFQVRCLYEIITERSHVSVPMNQHAFWHYLINIEIPTSSQLVYTRAQVSLIMPFSLSVISSGLSHRSVSFSSCTFSMDPSGWNHAQPQAGIRAPCRDQDVWGEGNDVGCLFRELSNCQTSELCPLLLCVCVWENLSPEINWSKVRYFKALSECWGREQISCPSSSPSSSLLLSLSIPAFFPPLLPSSES